MTDDASFWTARGTLRFEGPVGEEGSGKDREVVVAYVKTDTPVSSHLTDSVLGPKLTQTAKRPLPALHTVSPNPPNTTNNRPSLHTPNPQLHPHN